MASEFNGKVFTFTLIKLLLVAIFTECCIKKPDTRIEAEEMAARSDFILYGTVEEKIIPDPRTPKISTSYGIKFRVMCIYKGDPTSDRLKEELITIAGAGVVDESCYSLQVDVGSDYTIFLNDEGSHIIPSYGAPSFVQDLFELILVCGLKPKLPGGLPAPAEDCPSSDPVDCIKYVFPTTTLKPNASSSVKPNKPVTLKPGETQEPTPKPADKETVHAEDKEGIETNDNGASISCVISFFSLFICLISALYIS